MEDDIVPVEDMPDNMQSDIVPDDDLPEAPEPEQEADKPESEPLDLTTENIASKLSGPVLDMYDADITSGTPHEIAFTRISNTLAGRMQIKRALESITTEHQNKTIQAEKKASSKGRE